jgi:hypothetical protein
MASPAGGSSMRRISSNTKMRLLANANPLATVTGAETHNMNQDSMRRVASSSSLSSLRKWNNLFVKKIFSWMSFQTACMQCFLFD